MDEKLFSLAEIILGVLFALVIDLLAAIASALSAGVLGAVVHAFTWLLFSLWFTIKGAKITNSLAGRYLIPIAAQAIPFLPTTTATFLVSTYMENNPEKFAIVESTASVAGTIAKL